MALGKFGITIAPFVAAFAAMVFGASFAIQGPLANYGAGFVIILTRPFVVGNTISVKGVSGVVEKLIQAIYKILTEGNVQIPFPRRDVHVIARTEDPVSAPS